MSIACINLTALRNDHETTTIWLDKRKIRLKSDELSVSCIPWSGMTISQSLTCLGPNPTYQYYLNVYRSCHIKANNDDLVIGCVEQVLF